MTSTSQFTKLRHGRKLKRFRDKSNPCLFSHDAGVQVILYTYDDDTFEIGAFGGEDTANGWWRERIESDSTCNLAKLIASLNADTETEGKSDGVKPSKIHRESNGDLVIEIEYVESEDVQAEDTSGGGNGEQRRAAEKRRRVTWKTETLAISPVGPDIVGCSTKDQNRVLECATSYYREKAIRDRHRAKLRELLSSGIGGGGMGVASMSTGDGILEKLLSSLGGGKKKSDSGSSKKKGSDSDED